MGPLLLLAGLLAWVIDLDEDDVAYLAAHRECREAREAVHIKGAGKEVEECGSQFGGGTYGLPTAIVGVNQDHAYLD
ncbi:hypothetical protein CXB45_03200 [Corynebacterium mastitidis]|uniref:Uncharacterized protein n=2 Tax=Corynebacterium mastitidis TaxID=161890 RepID=A0A2N0X8Y9_9CORY|nr:hypothetical protein CXB45_03200 [Corynebacterium mastitidis]